MKQSNVTYVWLLLLCCYCGLIYWLSDQSHLPVPYVFNMQDKFIHATAYAVMALLFWQTIRNGITIRQQQTRVLCAIACVLFCSLYGITDEWHQSFVPGRDASFFDWLADTAGAFLLTMALYKRERVLLQHQ